MCGFGTFRPFGSGSIGVVRFNVTKRFMSSSFVTVSNMTDFPFEAMFQAPSIEFSLALLQHPGIQCQYKTMSNHFYFK